MCARNGAWICSNGEISSFEIQVGRAHIEGDKRPRDDQRLSAPLRTVVRIGVKVYKARAFDKVVTKLAGR